MFNKTSLYAGAIKMLKTNEYFDGNVKSIAFATKDKPATVGVMAPGEYVFNTADKEKITVISGQLEIQFKDQHSTAIYNAGESFEVAENSSFSVGVISDTAYLCVYG